MRLIPGLSVFVVVSLVERDGFAHESQPPVKGTGSQFVANSTNGISTPSALALEYTSLAVERRSRAELHHRRLHAHDSWQRQLLTGE